MNEDDVREVMRHDVRRHGFRRLDPRRRSRRADPPSGLRNLSAQDPLRPRREDHHAGSRRSVRAPGFPPRSWGFPIEASCALVRSPMSSCSIRATFRDAATFEQPTLFARGLKHLFVNGRSRDRRRRSPGGREYKTPSFPAVRCAGKRDGQASLIVRVKRIWTGDPANPWAEAVAVRDGAIAAVGTTAEVDRFRGPLTRVIDRPDLFAFPGLIDCARSHGVARRQPGTARFARRGFARRGRAPGEGACRSHRRRARGSPAGTGTRASGRAPSFRRPPCSTGLLPAGRSGSSASTATPAGRAPKRCVWPRSKRTPRPRASGQIIRDPAGNPTGVFIDGAMGLVGRAVPSPGQG